MYGEERGGVSMMPFMSFQCLGDAFESTYKRIYTGGGAEFGANVVCLVHMLGQLADAGMITNMTRKNMETFLTKDLSLSKMEIISRNTNDVVLINTDIHEQEFFDLVEYITWITDELCKDPLMKKALCGRDNYEGVKKILNSYADIEHGPVMKETWVDFYIYEDKVFYTKKDEGGIHLYMQEKHKDSLPFPERNIKYKGIQLVQESLLNGRIYHFADDTVFVETDYGYIVRISDVKGEKCGYSKIGGAIINQLEDGSLLFIEDGKLIRLRPNGRKKVLVDNAFLGMTCIEGNKVFWKSRFRNKDLETGNHNFEDRFINEKIKPCIKTERISKEMLWKGLLFTLYDFDYMEFDNKIGNRLRFARFFDKLPVPFTIDEISRRLSEIEQYCYFGDIIKAAGYAEAMSYLMSIEDTGLDEKQTFNALVYLLDNVTVNPYEMIANNAGTEVMNCMDFFFGGLDHIGEEPTIDDDMDDLLTDCDDDFDIEEIKRNIDRKIAELEKQIEEEDRKEKEAAEVEKSEKQSSSKSKKGRQDKRKSEVPNESEIGRSAEGIETPFDD